MKTFERMESEVRSYCRSFPTVFTKATGHTLIDEQGDQYIDFFAGAGALNYGHNNPLMRDALLEYIASEGVTHSLDMATTAKRRFLEVLDEHILKPRDMTYKIMFPGPTGTNAVEAALKLARKVTGRSNVIAFTNGFHGMTLGSLALTGNAGKRAGAGVSLHHTSHMPFCGYFDADTDTIAMLDNYLADASSGIEAPAAFVVETVQAEGGVNVASREWLKRLETLARKYGVLLIVDDIQVGCGRTGPFFSFEKADISPDIICLSKSLSGYGLPLALTLIKPEWDQWDPGEHNGTFRGHNLAFVTATTAIEAYWQSDELTKKVNQNAAQVRDLLFLLAEEYDGEAEVRGRGMIQGIAFDDPTLAGKISQAAFKRGLIIETAGPQDEVLKSLPPLTITPEGLERGLEIIHDSAREVLPMSSSRPANDIKSVARN
ncbi:diaminobutyrate--2-oxoglutarate transaminase [Lignipirellula cremea]|uniref:Diaminobutyrate--2-oxoglutarate transaminase n=1 Tax=Lignipirellula cremea TaxID=2528010 RepID=A0A518DXW1_9BACT|nr:diaminobutyrate--2-oxoglutarate transaminase [Lignipirellula cremea]QDU96687.1 Diaminobutyrate--2-oxoglutarate transaminase [Lignipirellula cremea]